MYRVRIATTLLVITFAAVLFARDTTKELLVSLKFSPQEGVASNSPDLTPAALERTLDIRVEDKRGSAEPLTIGHGTNDDDRKFPIKAGGDPVAFVQQSLNEVASAWSVKTASPADRTLKVQLMRYSVDESNKAVGSVYAAEVKLAYVLQDKSGKKLAEGVASGSAHRYGRARSADNCNEVLSDSLKEAFANVLSDSTLQTAWASGKATSGGGSKSEPAAKESVEERIRKLDDLLKKGLITKDEHAKRKAEILSEI